VTKARTTSLSVPQLAARCGLALEPFQKRITRAAGGPEREFVCLLPRGAGKTTVTAVVALHHLLTVEGAAVYCVAASVPQARILFEAAAGYARKLGHPNIVFRHLELRFCPDPAEPKVFTGHMRVLGAEAPRLHGLDPTLMLLDELQALSGDQGHDIYSALASALHKNPTAKLIVISTAGQGTDSPLGRLRARALAQPSVKRRGALTDARGDGIRMLEWAVPKDANIDSARVVKAANPRSSIGVKQLSEQRQRLPELAYRRYVCNMWTERQGHFLPEGAWQACVGVPEFADGEPIVVGVDVGGERSSSAVVFLNERLDVGVEIFYGERGVFDCIDLVGELASRYDLVEVAFDPWRFAQASLELEERGIPTVRFDQTDQRMIPASQRLHEAIVEQRLTLPDHPELAQHAANTVARHGRRGWRIDKPSKGTHVDGIIALCMALERMENRPQPTEFLGWLGPDGFEPAA
jgi:phage terminase large subunit-like protein